MADQSMELIYGPRPYRAYGGGSLWLKDDVGWFMILSVAGIEWAAQFCADPKKVDLLRKNAKQVAGKFKCSTQHQALILRGRQRKPGATTSH